MAKMSLDAWMSGKDLCRKWHSNSRAWGLFLAESVRATASLLHTAKRRFGARRKTNHRCQYNEEENRLRGALGDTQEQTAAAAAGTPSALSGRLSAAGARAQGELWRKKEHLASGERRVGVECTLLLKWLLRCTDSPKPSSSDRDRRRSWEIVNCTGVLLLSSSLLPPSPLRIPVNAQAVY